MEDSHTCAVPHTFHKHTKVKSQLLSRVWWSTPLVPVLEGERQRQANLRVQYRETSMTAKATQNSCLKKAKYNTNFSFKRQSHEKPKFQKSACEKQWTEEKTYFTNIFFHQITHTYTKAAFPKFLIFPNSKALHTVNCKCLHWSLAAVVFTHQKAISLWWWHPKEQESPVTDALNYFTINRTKFTV